MDRLIVMFFDSWGGAHVPCDPGTGADVGPFGPTGCSRPAGLVEQAWANAQAKEWYETPAGDGWEVIYGE